VNRKQRRAGAKQGGAVVKPRLPDSGALFAAGLLHHEAGRLDEAERLYRRILSQNPDHADSLHQLGIIATQSGRLDVAAALIAQAVALNPGEAWFLSNLGAILQRQKRLDEALDCHRRALALQPDYPAAHNNLGAVLLQQWRLEEAETCFRRAVALRPDYAEAHSNLGNTLREQRRTEEAIICQCRAVALSPDSAEAHNSLGAALQDLGRLDEALACYQRALSLKPDCVEGHTNLGTALKELGRLDEAYACYHRALSLDPHYPEVHWQYAYALLWDGRLRDGWEEYEWRWLRTVGQPKIHPDYAQPLWSGEATTSGTILLWSEQGFGDAIQFVRYAPAVARLGWRVILQTSRPLHRLFESIPGLAVVPEGAILPPFDVHCPLLSLPRAFATTVETIPAPIPYLHPRPELVADWRERLAGCRGRKVGLVWRGNPQHNRDRHRSMDPRWFSHFLDLPGLDGISLQPDGRAEELAALGGAEGVLDAGPGLGDYADTAALVANLDLVISVDSSVCHLAGALGVPIWTLVDFASEWRWLRGRDDSPWYPTMRLFRQPRTGDWHSVVEAVKAALLGL